MRAALGSCCTNDAVNDSEKHISFQLHIHFCLFGHFFAQANCIGLEDVTVCDQEVKSNARNGGIMSVRSK